MKYTFFLMLFIGAFLCVVSCQKEPQKGKYKGEFSGRYENENSATSYTTIYYFNVTHSTKKELRLQEKQSQMTSILTKHANDSISGGIGFGGIYSPDGNSSVRFNFITIQGKYDKNSIRGTFSTTFTNGNKDYPSEGNFIISTF